MKTIYLPAGTEYVCVAELLRCVYQTGRDGVYEVYESEAGELELRMKGCAPSKNEMKTQFNAFCKRESIEPTSQIDRWEKNYTGKGLQDGMYEVTVTEAERFAAPFRVSFQVEGPAQTAATPVPAVDVGASGDVEPDKAGPLPLTTGDIAFCFAGLSWNEQEWKKPLGDKPKWLSACIAIPAVRGVSESRWNPVLIGASLVRVRHVKPKSVRAKFQTHPLLKPWLDEWKTYEADNLSAD